jgi:dihydrofolate synthase/folylpolyglutamate synthase
VDQFRAANVDVAILEVGLGGRLDAVNLWDADVAIVASVGTDHRDWLGPDREAIGREKAGIYRRGRCAICGDADPPATLLAHAAAIDARLLRIHRDFDYELTDGGWRWRAGSRLYAGLPHPAMRGDYQLDNAACAIMALDCLAERLPVQLADIRAGLHRAVLPGRFQTLPGRPLRVFDVAHNIEAAQALARTLARQPIAGRTIAVCGMLRDKPIAEVLRQLAPQIDAWHLASLEGARGASAEDLRAALAAAGVETGVTTHAHVEAAYAAAVSEASEPDRVLVFGSFHTVGAILRALSTS